MTFSTSPPDRPIVAIDNLGLFLPTENGFKWICDEALTPFPGLNGVATFERGGFISATRTGLYRSDDNACHFEIVIGELEQHVIGHLLKVQTAESDIFIAGTQTLGRSNDLFRSEDGGLTWSAAGLEFRGRIRNMIGSTSDTDRLYVVHSEGGLCSRDGGRSFEPMVLIRDGIAMKPTEVDLLTTHPSDADTLYAIEAGFPTAHLIRSTDAGQSWTSIFTLDDVPDSLVIGEDGQNMMLAAPIAGLYASADAGVTWTPIERPQKNLWMGCLTLSAQNTIWACVRDDDTRLLIESEDWGQTWQTALSPNLEQVIAGLGCDPSSPSAQACAYTCEDVPLACTVNMQVPASEDPASMSMEPTLENSIEIPMSGTRALDERTSADPDTATSGCVQTGLTTTEVYAILVLIWLYRRRIL